MRRFLRAHLRRITAVFLGKLVRKPREQRQDIFATLAQRRHSDAQRRQTIKQIRAQRVLDRAVLLLQVRDRDNPRFRRIALLVHEAQQARLNSVRERLNIFKHKCAPARLFHSRQAAVFGLHRAKEPLHQRFFFQSRTAHQHKFLTSTRTNRVQSMCHKRLACARLAINQNMAVSLPQIEDIFLEPCHNRAGTDQLLHQLPAL